jgi:Fe-S-cluster-containing dehydrogenase component
MDDPKGRSEPAPREVRAARSYWEDLVRRLGAEPPDPTGREVSRRDFLGLLGASMALAGVGACTERPRERILPWHREPPEVTPGRPLFYATSMSLDGHATGLLVETNVGRPTKVEGNPEHPASLGATGVLEQASLLGLYDPDRARRIREGTVPSSWRRLLSVLEPGAHPDGGRGLHIVLPPTGSPLVSALVDAIRDRLPEARFHFHAPLSTGNGWEGARLAFGRVLDPVFDLEAADVVLTVDADFLATGPFHLRNARQFGARRRPEHPRGMNRLYAIESGFTPTGAMADHRLAVSSRAAAGLLGAVLAEVAGRAGAGDVLGGLEARRPDAIPAEWVRALAEDLLAHRGRAAVVVGERQPAAVHAMGHALAGLVDAPGATARYVPPSILEAGEASHDPAILAGALEAGEVRTLVTLGVNPLYDGAGHDGLVEAWGRADRRIHLGLYEDETAAAADWFVHQAHVFESWGDARAFDGTVSLVQPLIRPLYGGFTETQILAAMAGLETGSPHDLLQSHWRRETGLLVFDPWWREAVQRGVVAGTAASPVAAAPNLGAVADAAAALDAGTAAGIELALRPDPRTYDGRFANNAWLLELPESLTQLCWTNPVLLGPATADRLGVRAGDVLRLRADQTTVEAPAEILVGHPEDVATLSLGWGRRGGGRLARDRGADAYRLRRDDAFWFRTGVDIENTGRRMRLARVQEEDTQHGRNIARSLDLETFAAEGIEGPHDWPSFRMNRPTGSPQWAMAIDLSACLGCNACAMACQAENNVPVVGPGNVALGRQMHWLRLDRYFEGDAASPDTRLQPMLCQHCETAPCEYVCPVNATVHSPDGLNEMVYNRCVGTRFCSNNCPYKVRRFNYFDYNRDRAETEKMVANPQVTVRARGVMEKCTFCVQRIRTAQIDTRTQGRTIADGELLTACQQACPTEAIVFGDMTDPDSRVSRLREGDRGYDVLEELATFPRIRYLARIRNPNPALQGVAEGGPPTARRSVTEDGEP